MPYTNTFLEAYSTALQDKIKEIEYSLARGSASSWEDYKSRVGAVKGYEDAYRIFVDTAKACLDEDEIDDSNLD